MQKKQYEEMKEFVYNLMNGAYDLERYLFPAGELVENEFGKGKVCAKYYKRVFDANRRLCKRLGVDNDDADVECIISNMLDIARILSLKMFDYGTQKEKLEKLCSADLENIDTLANE